MASLSNETIARLLTPFDVAPGDEMLEKLSVYLDLLLRWNVRTNLSAIRAPEEIVVRHFGESLFTAKYAVSSGSLLDYGSGAGFPGIPIALARPGLTVVLGESQNKKVSFLREAVRTLGISAEIWPARVESMPGKLTFDCVSLRAVDNMASALFGASQRAASTILMLTTSTSSSTLATPLDVFVRQPLIPIPSSDSRALAIFTRG